MPTPAQATLDWRDEIPVSRRFDDPYFSLAGGLDETRHVFLAGNRLAGAPDRRFPHRRAWLRHRPQPAWPPPFFGTAWAPPARSASPASRPFRWPPETWPAHCKPFLEAAIPAAQLLQQWTAQDTASGSREITLPGLSATILTADARTALPQWSGQADAWFLDGFSPAKNPELWSPEILAEVARHTAPHGTFATYTAAGHVRRALTAAGFTVTRAPGYAHKRHMTTGHLPPNAHNIP